MGEIALPLILLIVGAAAFFLEAFIPSGGLISVLAGGCLVAAVLLAFTRLGTPAGLVFLAISLVVVPVSLVLAFAVFPKTAIGRRLTLRSAQTQEDGYVGQNPKEKELLGQTGVALSNLRPAGAARIAGRRYDVVTEGDMVEKGAAIEVRRIEGNRIVVRELKRV